MSTTKTRATVHQLPFGPKDLLVTSAPPNCTSAASTPLEQARCRNWALGQWYRSHLVKSDAGDQTLQDLDSFQDDERVQLGVAGVGLGAVVAGVGVLLFR